WERGRPGTCVAQGHGSRKRQRKREGASESRTRRGRRPAGALVRARGLAEPEAVKEVKGWFGPGKCHVSGGDDRRAGNHFRARIDDSDQGRHGEVGGVDPGFREHGRLALLAGATARLGRWGGVVRRRRTRRLLTAGAGLLGARSFLRGKRAPQVEAT